METLEENEKEKQICNTFSLLLLNKQVNLFT